MIALIYVSTAPRPLGEPELDQILDVSRRNNVRDGITGMLLYADGNFIQVVEGPEPAIADLMSRLEGDRRHRDVRTIYRYDVSERQFPDWSMSFRRLRRLDAGDIAQALSSSGRPIYNADAPDSRSVAHKLLESFRQHNRL